jgi:hypothetical protein
MVDLPRVDHRPEPGACLRGALHRHQQRKQLGMICLAGVFAERSAQREMFCSCLRREFRRVGGHKGEWRIRIATVLGKIEMHAADQVPGRVQLLEAPPPVIPAPCKHSAHQDVCPIQLLKIAS